MKNNLFLLTLLLFIIPASRAQDSCNCLANLDTMIYRVTNNYAGYKDKVNAHTQSRYNMLVDSLRKAAVPKLHIGDCYPLLQQYRLYFYDKHLQLQLKEQQQQTTASATPVTQAPIQTGITKKMLTDSLQKTKRKLNTIEGIWTTDGYEIGILYNDRNKTFDAIVFTAANKNWSEGMLKFRSKPSHGMYATEYYRGDFNKENVSLNLFRNIIEIERFGVWQKKYPVTADTISKEEYLKNHSAFSNFQLRYPDKNTVYIALRSCDLSIKPILDSTLLSNKEKLKKIPNWIVDFRGNEGGATDVFLNLLPYLYTKPMIAKGSSHWMTADNTNELNKFFNESKSLLDTSTYNEINSWLQFEKKNPNGWYRGRADTTRYDSIYRFPKRVAVLSDKNNASSGETFLIVAHGISDKVTIMGENSAGYLDYGDLLPSSLPCNKLALYIPSRRANYLDDGISYDRTGYPPDVYIPKETTDWIQFVYNWWNKHPGTWDGKKTIKK